MKKAEKITYYVLLTLISLGFILAAYPKIIADPMAVQGFATAHLPIWFLYFIGYCEALGAIGLWIPKLQKWAAGGLFIILTGAVVTTIIFVNPYMAVMPFAYGCILAIILWLGKRKNVVLPQASQTDAGQA